MAQLDQWRIVARLIPAFECGHVRELNQHNPGRHPCAFQGFVFTRAYQKSTPELLDRRLHLAIEVIVGLLIKNIDIRE